MKVIVFDFDETIGYFAQFGDLISILENLAGTKLTKSRFFKILDLYPNLWNPSAIEAFNYLKQIKTSKIKVVIYTNNMGGRDWLLTLIQYIDKKLGKKIFDRVILAYKIGNKQIEKTRTSHDKTYKDLKKAMRLSDKVQILFFDDQLHSIRANSNVKYIHLVPYKYVINRKTMIKTLIHSSFGKTIMNKQRFKARLEKELTYTGKTGRVYGTSLNFKKIIQSFIG